MAALVARWTDGSRPGRTVLENLSSLATDNLLLLAVPLFLISMAFEATWSLRRRLGLYETQDTLSSLAMGALAMLVEIVPKAVAFLALDILHDLSPLRNVVERRWWAWALLIVLDDLTYYTFHRANHSIRLLWAGHVPHHSSLYLNLGTALRQGVGERLHKFVFWLPLPLLGFDPVMIFTVMALSLLYQFFIHTQAITRLPRPVEWLFNTPSHHRVHHAANAIYLDRNHGGVFIVWDRLFGTFVSEQQHEPPRFGLTRNPRSRAPLSIATHEYQAIIRDLAGCGSLREKLYCIFGPPDQGRRGTCLVKIPGAAAGRLGSGPRSRAGQA